MYQTTNKFVAIIALSLIVLGVVVLVTVASAIPRSSKTTAGAGESNVSALTINNTTPQAFSGSASLMAPALGPAPQVNLAAMDQKLRIAHALLTKVWGSAFYSRGFRFAPPAVQPYYTPIHTPCGPTRLGNALYCPADHKIYFDVNFFASEMIRAGQSNRTDGDLAPIVILAHEWGHAIQHMGGVANQSQGPELQADCLAGAFILATKQYLDPGDWEEAIFSLRAAGDDAWSYRHGTGQERVNSFSSGFNGGAGFCGFR